MKAIEDMVTKVSADGFNKTQLNIKEDMERNVFHRDRLAHFFRWAHIMRAMKPGYSVVDLGCGTGNLATMLYANRMKPNPYIGVDIRGKTMDTAEAYFEGRSFDARFVAGNLCMDGWQEEVLKLMNEHQETTGARPDIITSFEFVEHVPENDVEPFLVRVKNIMDKYSSFYLSTPCFDGVRKAENHVKEWYYQELKDLLSKHFNIENHWGTFISQKDLEPEMNDVFGNAWDRLREYYGSETLAILYAPLFPSKSRNCIWQLVLK